VLMQSARKVQSAETRGHLQDAHSRVMSIAAVQRQLVVSKVGDVELRAYFNQLCDSLGASMIENHDQLSVEVNTYDSLTTPDASVSLGLIVTELVINALKHAFPGNRRGKIKVDYRSDGKAWTLSVKDDGVGIHQDPTLAKPGLGTSIVTALSAQLHAVVSTTDAQPGTMVSIVHA
jgi:two-component system, sensor histidine kinase PdtaS